YEEPLGSERSPACKSKKRKKHNNPSIEIYLAIFGLSIELIKTILRELTLMAQSSRLCMSLQSRDRKRYSKQSEQLIDTQEKCRYPKIYQTINDMPTRWNSSYLAWVWLKELQKAIEYLVIIQSQLIEEDDPESDIENEFDTLVSSEQLQQPLQEDYRQPSVGLDKPFNTPDREPAIANSLIAALYSNKELNDEIYNKTEVDHYLCEPIEKRGCDLLTWWKNRSEKYPVLS
ncbi:7405_t:CDS:2, partial [Dentiscutata heterogama]